MGERYNCIVRARLRITLPADLLREIDRVDPNRSAFVERAVRAYLARIREAQDLRIINVHADRLNKEAMDVLGYRRCE